LGRRRPRCWPDGFANNAGLGRLILDGGDDSSFIFKRTGATNALYVDYLEFRNFMTNQDNTTPSWRGINLETNFTIYYAQAVLNGRSIAERLNGQFGADYTNGGQFRWVSNYHAGFFSSTNVVYRDGTTHRFNTALVTSRSIDSNGNGIPTAASRTRYRSPRPPTWPSARGSPTGPSPVLEHHSARQQLSLCGVVPADNQLATGDPVFV